MIVSQFCWGNVGEFTIALTFNIQLLWCIWNLAGWNIHELQLFCQVRYKVSHQYFMLYNTSWGHLQHCRSSTIPMWDRKLACGDMVLLKSFIWINWSCYKFYTQNVYHISIFTIQLLPFKWHASNSIFLCELLTYSLQ